MEKKRIVLEGNLPSVLDPPLGCPFNTRCHRKLGEPCETDRPPEQEDAPGHLIACHIPMAALREMDPVIVMHDEAIRDDRLSGQVPSGQVPSGQVP